MRLVWEILGRSIGSTHKSPRPTPGRTPWRRGLRARASAFARVMDSGMIPHWPRASFSSRGYKAWVGWRYAERETAEGPKVSAVMEECGYGMWICVTVRYIILERSNVYILFIYYYR